jgi:hypothetical protein
MTNQPEVKNNPFKVGDKVRLADFHENNKGSAHGAWCFIRVRTTYNVRKVTDEYIYLEETLKHGEGGYYWSNFVKDEIV